MKKAVSMLALGYCWFPFFMVALGALGLFSSTFREIRALAPVKAKGAFWEARNKKGQPLEVERTLYLRLNRNESICLLDEGGGEMPYGSFSFVVSRETESSSFQVAFQERIGRTLILRDATSKSKGIGLAWMDGKGKITPISLRTDQDFLPAFLSL